MLGEAMKPFLGYGWQPQIMAVEGRQKAILAGKTEVYDVIADPAEAKNLGAGANLSPALRKALDDYPVPSPEAARAPENLTDEARRNLASLGYVSASTPPVVRKDAPRPADMVGALRHAREGVGTLRRRSGTRRSSRCSRRSSRPIRTTSTRRCVWRRRTRRSARTRRRSRRSRGPPRSRRARRTFEPTWPCTTREARTGSRPCHCSSASSPKRPSACRRSRRWPSSANVRDESQDAIALRQKIAALRAPTAADLVRLGQLAMQAQQTTLAIESFERRASEGGAQLHARPRAGRAVSGSAPVHRRAERARSRPAVTSGVSDGALQARAGERALEGAGQRRAHRARASARGPNDARAHRKGEAVSVNRSGSRTQHDEHDGHDDRDEKQTKCLSSRPSCASWSSCRIPWTRMALELGDLKPQPCRQLDPSRIVERSRRREVGRVHGGLDSCIPSDCRRR